MKDKSFHYSRKERAMIEVLVTTLGIFMLSGVLIVIRDFKRKDNIYEEDDKAKEFEDEEKRNA